MITGRVRDNDAFLRCRLMGPASLPLTIEAVIDTGYTGALTLPLEMIQHLSLEYSHTSYAILANDEAIEYDIYRGQIEWDGNWLNIEIDHAESGPLVGMSLLHSYELKMKVRHNGRVTIRKLPRK